MHRRLSAIKDKLFQVMKNKPMQRVFYILVILISLGFIAYATYANWNELKAYQWELNYPYIIFSVILFPVGMLPAVAAWHKLLEALGVKLGYVRDLRIYAISSLPRHIPGLVWYVSSRAMLYKEEGVAAGIIMAATGAEVFLHAVTGFLMSVLLLVRSSGAIEKYSALRYVIPIALLLLIGLLLSPPVFNRLLPRLVKRWNFDQIPTIQRNSLIACLLWLIPAWSGGGFLLFLLVHGLSPINWSYLPVMIGIWALASAIGLTVGIGVSGMGLREVTLGALLSLVIPPITAIVAAIAFRLVLIVGEFLWVMIFVWIIKSAPKKPQGRRSDIP